MASEELLESELSVLPLHFDVENHLIETETLISGIKAVEDIATAINNVHFDGNLSFRVCALPSNEGGHIVNLVLVVATAIVGGIPVAISINESKTLAGFIEGYTGKPYDPSKISRYLGRALRNATGGFLLTENKDITDITQDNPDYDKSFKSKSDFMCSCLNNTDILGLGFSNEHKFPIKRVDLIKHISDSKERIKPSQVQLVSGHIVSPVLLEHENRQWAIKVTHEDKNRLNKPKLISAHLDDEEFARDFFAGKHPVKDSDAPDSIEVEILISKVTKDGKTKGGRIREIKKVILFKDERLVDEEYKVGTASKIPPNPNQDDLFSRLEDESEDK